jgi:hypothetical protein
MKNPALLSAASRPGARQQPIVVVGLALLCTVGILVQSMSATGAVVKEEPVSKLAYKLAL